VRFEEQVEVRAAPAEVWDLIWDVPRMAACVPGCREAAEVEPGQRYTAVIEQNVGQFRSRFDLALRAVESQKPSRMVIAAQGTDSTTGSHVTGTLTLELQGGERSTSLHLTTEVRILGKLASLGQGVIGRKTSEVVEQFARSLGEALA
jgi:carbon monoxide dehydrogenase subunit G